MSKKLGNEDSQKISFSSDFIEKYHPITTGSAMNINQVADNIYQGINNISITLKSGNINDIGVLLDGMRDDITPKIVKIGEDVNIIEKNQKTDRRLAIISIVVAIFAIIIPYIFH